MSLETNHSGIEIRLYINKSVDCRTNHRYFLFFLASTLSWTIACGFHVKINYIFNEPSEKEV